MPKVHRKTDITTGHNCFPPTIPATYSPDTFGADQLNVVRYGDIAVPHCCDVCHTPVYIGQKCEVYVNERYVQLKDDPLDCGDFVATHDPTWDCCTEPMPMLEPQIQVNPKMLDFQNVPVGNSSTIVSTDSILGDLELPFIPIVIINVGGPNLIIQYATYGPINPQEKNIGCNPVDGTSTEEYPDFIFKDACFPYTLGQGQSKIFYVKFKPLSVGIKTMTVNIHSQPNQPIEKIILKGTGIGTI